MDCMVKGYVLSLVMASFLPLSGCGDNPFAGIPHRAETDLKVSLTQLDTLYINADQTSLEGQWLMWQDSLYFLDMFSAGVRVYDLDGNYVHEAIRAGRANHEIWAPSLVAAVDTHQNKLVFCDTQMVLNVFSENYEKNFTTASAWFTLLDEDFGIKQWNKLYRHPNPKEPEIYEYAVDSQRLVISEEGVTLPVESTHVLYNGYNVSNRARQCWKKNAVFITFDLSNIPATRRLWGRFPPVYQEGNYPVFAAVDICVGKDVYYVSFAADPKIYVYNLMGSLVESFGSPDTRISCKYPQTRTLEEYDRNCRQQLMEFGHYGRLFFDGRYLLRTYYTDEKKWGMQVYEGYTLVGDCMLPGPVEIIGKMPGGPFYAFASVDMDREQFLLLKFELL